MKRFLEFARRIVAFCGGVAALVFLPALIVVSMADIIGRRLFSYSSTPIQELEWHFFFGMVMLGMGYAYVRERHVRVDIFRERFPNWLKKRSERVMIVVFLLPFAVVLFWFGGRMALLSFAQDEGSRAALGLSARWVVKSTLPLGAVLLFLAGCWRLAHPTPSGKDDQ